MSTVEYTITLPEALAREAESIGIKMPQAVERLVRDEVRRRRGEEFVEMADRAAALELPPMSMEEIQAEVQAVRRERRGK
jgi:hypothetical protein